MLVPKIKTHKKPTPEKSRHLRNLFIVLLPACFRAHLPDHDQVRLEVHVMRQFQMLEKTSGLHVVSMHEHKLLVLETTWRPLVFSSI